MHKLPKAAAIIRHEGKFLLGKERVIWKYGSWNWTQGAIETGETPEVAVMREILEESGYESRILRKLDVLYETYPNTSEMHIYEAEITGGEFKIQRKELLDLQWFTREQVEGMEKELIGPWVLETIRKHF